MSLGRAKNEIPFVLTNSSTFASATINLFSLGSNSSSGTNAGQASGQQISINNSQFGTGNWTFTYNSGTTKLITTPTDIDDLVTKLNAFFTENGSGVFWKETGTGGVDWFLRVASNSYIFTTAAVPLNPTKTFIAFGGAFISGTTVSVQMETGVTYNEICVDLSTQPYVITTIYVSASDIDQVNSEFTMSTFEANGINRIRPYSPALPPDYSQFVQPKIPIYMATSAFNKLQYTLGAGEEVRMIIRYEHIELFDALELIQNGSFYSEMAKLRQVDFEQSERITTFVEKIAQEQAEKSVGNYAPEPNKMPETYKAVPLLFVVKKENGDSLVRIL